MEKKILLPHTYKELIDDIVLETRRLGVSVESYFQRFGIISHFDGYRKLDLGDFVGALAKLFKYTDTVWSDPKEHDMIKDMFREICKEFHQEEMNMHSQSIDNSTLSVEGTERKQKLPFNPDREKLSLLQIG